MAITTLILAAAIGLQTPAPDARFELHRKFAAGEKLKYRIEANVVSEMRDYEVATYFPSSDGYEYNFSIDVKSVDEDGIAKLIYKRPTMVWITGENHLRDERRQVLKQNYNMELKVSPVNDILDFRDLNEDKKKPAKSQSDAFWMLAAPAPMQQQAIVTQFTNEIFRIALMLGSFDSNFDFAPKLPERKVKAGDTWKFTMGYAPQRLQNDKKKRTVNQRLDFTYKYDGVVQVEGKSYQRVTADLSLDSDAAEMIHQTYGLTTEQTGIKAIKLELKTKLTFDLDMKSLATVRGSAESIGSFRFDHTQVKGQAVEDGKLKGKVEMFLVK